jgi:hypothetical protein
MAIICRPPLLGACDVNKTNTALLTLIGAALTIVIVGATGILWRYSLTPGVAGTPSALWPAQSSLAHKAGALTLVMVARPHCPCSRASIGELALLIAQPRETPDANVIFLEPPGFSDSWTKTDLWQSAIPKLRPPFGDANHANSLNRIIRSHLSANVQVTAA